MIARMNLKTATAQTATAVAMKTQQSALESAVSRRRYYGRFVPFVALALLTSASSAHASMFQGETLDSIANVISWVVLVIAPIIGITVFWLVHVMPEKIAHKKKHPQTHAIHCLCLLSLCFGGLLWPIAWLWAYTKPVMHKLAYGTDVDESLGHLKEEVAKEESEVERLRARIAQLERQVTGGKA
jgi:protein-S-isoprenylcysteine O-methyltransferase Ste14